MAPFRCVECGELVSPRTEPGREVWHRGEFRAVPDDLPIRSCLRCEIEFFRPDEASEFDRRMDEAHGLREDLDG